MRTLGFGSYMKKLWVDSNVTVVSEMEAVELALPHVDDRSGDQKHLLCAQYRDRFHTDGARGTSPWASLPPVYRRSRLCRGT